MDMFKSLHIYSSRPIDFVRTIGARKTGKNQGQNSEVMGPWMQQSADICLACHPHSQSTTQNRYQIHHLALF